MKKRKERKTISTNIKEDIPGKYPLHTRDPAHPCVQGHTNDWRDVSNWLSLDVNSEKKRKKNKKQEELFQKVNLWYLCVISYINLFSVFSFSITLCRGCVFVFLGWKKCNL